MIPLLLDQTKTADTAHKGIFESDIRPLSRFLGGGPGDDAIPESHAARIREVLLMSGFV